MKHTIDFTCDSDEEESVLEYYSFECVHLCPKCGEKMHKHEGIECFDPECGPWMCGCGFTYTGNGEDIKPFKELS